MHTKNIVLEGPDGGGKTTLARFIRHRIPLTLLDSGGPPQYPGEMQTRIQRLLLKNGALFDRHPCVSQPIFGHFRPGQEMPTELQLKRFYSQGNLLIFCDNLLSLKESHDATNEIADSEEHLALIERHDTAIRSMYREWADSHDVLRYKVGDSIEALVAKCEEYFYAT